MQALAGLGAGRPSKTKKPTPEQLASRRRRLWVSLSKKEIPRVNNYKTDVYNPWLSSLLDCCKSNLKVFKVDTFINCTCLFLPTQEQKKKAAARKEMLACLKKVAKEGQKESRRQALQSQKLMKEGVVRARRLSKEMMVYWKRFEKVEKEHRRKAEKEAQEQRKMDVEHREVRTYIRIPL